MATKTQSIKSFDANTITFSDVKKNANGGKFITLSAKNQPIRVQLPALKAPFGINFPNEKVAEYYISLSLTDPDVIAKLSSIDDAALDFVVENSVELIGKKVDRTVMKDLLMTTLVRLPVEANRDKYAPTLKLKMSTRKGADVAAFYNHNQEEISLDQVPRGAEVATIIEFGQIWFINGKFGVSSRLLQGKVSQSSRLTGYAFDDGCDEIDIPDDA
jgi:Family of unknown function (DUF5871)